MSSNEDSDDNNEDMGYRKKIDWQDAFNKNKLKEQKRKKKDLEKAEKKRKNKLALEEK